MKQRAAPLALCSVYLGFGQVFVPAAKQLKIAPLQAAKLPSVMIVSAAHDYHCKYHRGDYLNLISAVNKQVRLCFYC